MNQMEAYAIVTGFHDEDVGEDTHIAAYQHLIDTGLVWTMPGTYGRTANQMIELGYCAPGEGLIRVEHPSDTEERLEPGDQIPWPSWAMRFNGGPRA